MVFNPLTQKPPVRWSSVSTLYEANQDADGNISYIARYRFTLVDEDGNKVEDPIESGDLIQHLDTTTTHDLTNMTELEIAKWLLDRQTTKVEGRLA